MKNKTSFGTASLVCGILGLCLWIVPYFAIVLSILAMVLYTKQREIKPLGRLTAGLVLGIVGVTMNAIMLFIILIVAYATYVLV